MTIHGLIITLTECTMTTTFSVLSKSVALTYVKLYKKLYKLYKIT